MQADDDEDHRSGEEALVEDVLERDHHDLGGQDEVGADRAADRRRLGLGPEHHRRHVGLRLVTVADEVVHLFGALEAQVRAAEHQDHLDEGGGNLAQHQGGRQDDQQLVAHRARGDLADDRQLALGGEPADIRGCHGRVVDHHPGGLRARPPGRQADVVDGGGGELRERGDVVE
jgi:hypothetical protein